MKIRITDGKGISTTEITAFHKALIQAGVAQFNLIYLSSVLPPGSKVSYEKPPKNIGGTWGDRLYVVMAQKRVSVRNQEAWAGIGWIQDRKTGQGLLAEHEGHSRAEVRADIESSLAALAGSHEKDLDFGPPQMHIVGTKCVDMPVCALVIAVFEPMSWQNGGKLPGFKLPGRT